MRIKSLDRVPSFHYLRGWLVLDVWYLRPQQRDAAAHLHVGFKVQGLRVLGLGIGRQAARHAAALRARMKMAVVLCMDRLTENSL